MSITSADDPHLQQHTRSVDGSLPVLPARTAGRNRNEGTPKKRCIDEEIIRFKGMFHWPIFGISINKFLVIKITLSSAISWRKVSFHTAIYIYNFCVNSLKMVCLTLYIFEKKFHSWTRRIPHENKDYMCTLICLIISVNWGFHNTSILWSFHSSDNFLMLG